MHRKKKDCLKAALRGAQTLENGIRDRFASFTEAH